MDRKYGYKAPSVVTAPIMYISISTYSPSKISILLFSHLVFIYLVWENYTMRKMLL